MIRANNIFKKLPGFKIRNVSLEIKRGEYFLILGPSGAGKTLILEMIAGLISPDSGVISVDKSLRIGLIYQDYMLFPHLTVFQNIAYGLKIKKEKKEKMESTVQYTSRQLSIEHLLHRDVRTLSGGERQRVAIARAMVMKPDILLLDEPTAALDLSLKNQTQKLLLDLHKRNQTTVLHVTHDFEEALALGDRMALLFEGEIVQMGQPERVFNHPTSKRVADFLGYKNVFSGKITKNVLSINGVCIKIPRQNTNQAYIAIRANDIMVSEKKIFSSARNSFPGTVLKIIKRTNHVEVVVDIGILLYADISYKSFQEMKPSGGTPVWVSFKTSAVKVFEN